MTPPLRRLKTRPEFLRVARSGRKWATPGLVLQAGSAAAEPAGHGEDRQAIGIGFTASRKVGNAVARNRARRRLKAAAAEVLPEAGRAGRDYVVIARAGTLRRPYGLLLGDLREAVDKVSRPGKAGARAKTGPRG